jgi:hypothetical protein
MSNFEFRAIKNGAIFLEICDFKNVTIDLKPTQSNENDKTHDKVDIRSYLQSLISVGKQPEDSCALSH